MKTILFQGDSITDFFRTNLNDDSLGCGYPLLVSSKLGFDRPAEFKFINRGVSGDRVVDIYARIKSDIINLKPDYCSILVGVNDIWHEIALRDGVERRDGVDAAKYEKIYSMLVEELLEALPSIKLMLLEPFVLKASATESDFERFQSEVALRAAAVRRIAEKYRLTFVPLQSCFDNALTLAPENYWLFDGVHPAPPGHELIEREWLKAFSSIS